MHIKLRTAFMPLALAALFVLPVCASAQAPVLLRLKFAKGEIHRFKMTMAMQTGMGGRSTPAPFGPATSAVVEQRVTRVFPDGAGEIVTHTASTGPMTPMNPMGKSDITSVLTTRGVVRTVSGASQGAGASPMSNMFSGGGAGGMALPANPVKPGDSWVSPLNVKNLISGGSVRTKFLRVEGSGANRVAVLRAEGTVSMNINPAMFGGGGMLPKGLKISGRLHMVSTTHLAMRSGSYQRIESSGDMDMHITAPPGTPNMPATPGGTTMRISMKSTLDRIP